MLVRREWDLSPDLRDLETCTPEEAWHQGWWACHNEMLNEISRLGAEMKRRRWPNMEAGVRKVLVFLVTGRVS